MNTWAVLASGPSMSQAVANGVRDLPCVVVNRTYQLAPWAIALVANDHSFWNAYPEAVDFPGVKLSTRPKPPHVQALPRSQLLSTGSNSGLVALHAAIAYGAQRVLLFGFDMHGEHWHGPHVATHGSSQTPLKNPTQQMFAFFIEQFRAYAAEIDKGIEVINCTPGSALDCFRFAWR